MRNFQAGTHYQLYKLFGNKQLQVNGIAGTYFAVWAPSASAIFVTGNFNGWNELSHPLHVRPDSSGIWEGFIPDVAVGELYKYHIHGFEGVQLNKADPFAHYAELTNGFKGGKEVVTGYQIGTNFSIPAKQIWIIELNK